MGGRSVTLRPVASAAAAFSALIVEPDLVPVDGHFARRVDAEADGRPDDLEHRDGDRRRRGRSARLTCG